MIETSIIIPVYKRSDLTKRCLNSLVATLPKGRCEVIVVDNASEDDTPQLLSNFNPEGVFDLKVITNESNDGFSRANNQAALKARGDYLLLLNNDTEAISGFYEALIQAAEANPDRGAIGAKLLYEDGTIQHAGVGLRYGTPRHFFRSHPSDAEEVNYSRACDMVTGACLLTPRELYLQLGGLDEAYLNGYEDVDYCIRLLQYHKQVWYEASAVLYHLESQTEGRTSFGHRNFAVLYNRWAQLFLNHDKIPVTDQPVCYQVAHSLIKEKLGVREGSLESPKAPEWARVEIIKKIAAHNEAIDLLRIVHILLDKPEEHIFYRYIEGWILWRNHKYQDAIRKFAGYLKYAPKDVQAHMHLSACFLQLKNFKKALEFANRAHKLQPNDRSIIGLISRIQHFTREFSARIEFPIHFDSASELTRREPLFSMVMLTYNNLSVTQQCISSIEAYATLPYEIIFVDNNSTDGTPQFLQDYVAGHPNHKLILNRQNHGFPGGNNQGFALAKAPFIVWTNNDVVVSPGWMDRFAEAFKRYPDYGILGPVSNHVAGRQLVLPESYANRSQFEHFAEKRFVEYEYRLREDIRVIGFFLAMRREVMEKLGGLDEDFNPGNYEDDDYCLRARLNDFRVGFLEGIYIHHKGSQSFGKQKDKYEGLLKKNYLAFCSKWGIQADLNTMAYRTQGLKNPNVAKKKVILPDLDQSHKKAGKIFSEKI